MFPKALGEVSFCDQQAAAVGILGFHRGVGKKGRAAQVHVAPAVDGSPVVLGFRV